MPLLKKDLQAIFAKAGYEFNVNLQMYSIEGQSYLRVFCSRMQSGHVKNVTFSFKTLLLEELSYGVYPVLLKEGKIVLDEKNGHVLFTKECPQCLAVDLFNRLVDNITDDDLDKRRY